LKVLFVIDTLRTGGAEKSIIQIAQRFVFFEPIICILYPPEDLKEECTKAGIPLVSLRVSGKYNFREAGKRLTELVKQEKPDIIHATLYRSEMVCRKVAHKERVPLLCSFVNDSYSNERFASLGLMSQMKLNLVKWYDRYTSKYVDHFMSITSAIVSTNCDALNIPPKKVTVIYRGRDLKRLSIDAEEKNIEILRGQYPNRPVFLTVARLLKRKGYIESISAFARVREKYPNAKYLIAGEGHDRDIFQKLIDSLNLRDHVFLLGNRGDVPDLLTFCDYFVFPSHYEGQGGALVEAMLFAKPIIATRIPVFEESVQHGVSCQLFALKDVEDLYTKMIWMIEHPSEAKTLGSRAKEFALMKFDIDVIAKQHEDLYKKIIHQRTVYKY
jgi:glycosyltransferase involved in cell wall biosynthesis